jgi:hypothetical protein
LRFSSDPSCRDSNRLADRSRQSTVLGPVQGRQDRRPHGLIFVGEGAAMPQGFRVVSKGGPFIASAATLTSNSLWTPAMLEQLTVVDAQRGGVIGVSARKFADEQIVIAEGQVRATRYTVITPYFAGSIWYDKANLWVRGEFEREGSKVQYQLDA